MSFKPLFLLAAALCFTHPVVWAADPLHHTQWHTIDDETGKAKALVTFTENNGLLFGKITKVFNQPDNVRCNQCKGLYQNQPLVGATIIRNLLPQGNGQYTGGKIDDPETGKTYRLNVKWEKNQLLLRGFIGISLIGRTQTWVKKP